MSQKHPNSEALRTAIRVRRAELKISQKDIQTRGGPSRAVVARYESDDEDGGGVTEGVLDSTLLGLDKALEWAPGTSRRILNGIDPVEPPQTNSPAPQAEEHSGVVIPTGIFQDMVRAQQEMIRAVTKNIDDLPPEVREAIDQVTVAQTDALLGLTDRMR